MMEQLICILILCPLVSFIANGLCYKQKSVLTAGSIGFLSNLISFILSVFLFYKLSLLEASDVRVGLWQWLDLGEYTVHIDLSFNRISSLMCLIITGIGALVHLFSIKYMEEDDTPFRYFSFLGLFIFSMLILVLGSNLLVTFIGWEGVGLSSYLLIGYWSQDLKNAAAGTKAFLANRIGDAGFVIGMILIFLIFRTLDYGEINSIILMGSDLGSNGLQSLALMALFIGVAGKSAQLPLFVWLPDAMAGPTPVSALIHAATMVTAGVFVLFRLNGLIDATPVVASTVAYVGAATALLGAFSALSQWDIKKVLAYSTVSQLGYMVMAIGVGSYVGAIFHLLTHAFFKGLLFLGAGSVIHALDGEQDMRKMGGLKKFMPYTHLGFVVGWWSLSGLPLFSGFFSKDEILYNTLFGVRGSWILWLMGLTAALMTSFYMTRLMFHVFWSPSRLAEDLKPHEGGPFFTAPLMLLSFFAVVFGFLGLPHVFSKVIPGHPTHMIGDWLSPMLSTHSNIEHSILSELSMMLASVVVAGSGVVLAYLLYIRKDENVDRVVQKIKINELTKASSMALYIDHSFNHYLVRPFSDLSKAIWLFIDQILIDQTISKFAKLIAVSGEIGKTLNNGRVQHYISIFVVILSMVLVGVLFS